MLTVVIYFFLDQRAYLSKQNVDVTLTSRQRHVMLTQVDVYRIFKDRQTLTLESVSFKSLNVNVMSTFGKADPSILLVDV